VAIYDTDTGRTHVYDEHDLEQCIEHLNSADLLVSFNGIEFDTPALQGVTGMEIVPDQYDILHEIWKALSTRTKGFKLDNICERLNLPRKNGNGERATDLYRDKRFGRLFDYCINDVQITRSVAHWINEHGFIVAPDGTPLELPRIGVEV
jgi:uncharacterized protein YprB with RNaseH-like and TPR domain